MPVQGYLITSSKIINFIAIKSSFYYYPEIAAYLAIAFMVGIFIAVWLSPTTLNYKWLCAVLMFLQPFNPEAFSVALYSFWWSGLLLVLALLWNNSNKLYFLKNSYIILGGLSSPLIIGLLPIFIFKFFLNRNTRELFTIGLVFFISFIQAYFIVTTGASQPGAFNLLDIILNVDILVEKFFGFYLFKGEYITSLIIGLLFVSYFIFSFYKIKNNKNIYTFSLMFLCVVFMSIYRVPLQAIDPVDAGPRYFFYPYIIITWAILFISGELGCKFKLVSFSLIFCSLVNVILNGGFYRRHDIIDWRGNINSCTFFDDYYLPYHYDGDSSHLGITELSKFTKEECSDLYESSIFYNKLPESIDDIVYRFIPFRGIDDFYRMRKYDFSTPLHWEYNAFYESEQLKLNYDYNVIGSFVVGDQFKGYQDMFDSEMGRVKVVYTTGPNTKGQFIEILKKEEGSDPVLLKKIPLQPSSMKWSIVEIIIGGNHGALTYRIVDDSSDWGEWSAYMVH